MVVACKGAASQRAREDAGGADASALAASCGDSRERMTLVRCAEAATKRAELEGRGKTRGEFEREAAARFEDAFRRAGVREDAERSIEHHEKAYEFAEDCSAAIRAAALRGEVERDAQTMYVALYKVQKAKKNACNFDAELKRLSAFRPDEDTLNRISGLLVGSEPVVSTETKITRVERYLGRDEARVVIYTNRPTAYRVADDVTVDGSPRTYVDFSGTVMAATIPREGKGVVRAVRSETTVSGVRVSLELDGRAFRKVFHLPEPHRVVIDIARTVPSSGGRAINKVVLDAGHGGVDPGAIGPTGLKEKDVTLGIVKAVQAQLTAQNLDVVLTRENDDFVSLEERTARANASRADLFVSVHCNAAENRTKRGLETYVLDTAIDDMAGRLAARENATSPGANAELASILATMRMADQAQRSTHFANLVQKSVLASIKPAYANAQDGGVHSAGFFVLVGARMPAALVEATYISNPDETALLADAAYQKRIATGIANAIVAFKRGK
jgi:N-acetylmuramoyl-L-alanine amidase